MSKKGSPEEIGKRLISFRISKGYNKQSAFLQAILDVIKEGITQGNLSHWETGKYAPDYENLLLIKKAFPDLDINHIYTGETLREVVDKYHPRSEDSKTDKLEIEKYKALAEFWEQKWKEDHK